MHEIVALNGGMMTTLLDHLDTRSAPAPGRHHDQSRPAAPHDDGRRPCLVHLVRRAEDPEHRAEGPGRRGFDAEGQFLRPARSCSTPATRRSGPSPRSGARSTLLEGAHPAYPEPGVRLIRQDAVEVRRPDDRLPRRTGRRRRRARPALRRAQAGRGPSGWARSSTGPTTPRPWSACSASGGSSRRSSRPITSCSSRPGCTSPSGAGRGPVRGGRAAGRAGVRRRVRPARRTYRAAQRRRRGRSARRSSATRPSTTSASSSTGSAR